MSCNVSEDLPPRAGFSFVVLILDLTKFVIAALVVAFGSSSNSILSTLVKTEDCTLSFTPPPTVYVIVNVVLAGAAPYALVYKKLEGSISTSIGLRNPANPFPTLSGFGIISSSLLSDIPAPN